MFDYKGAEVRTVERENQIWWVLKDVCEVLGLKNPTIVAERLDDDEVTKFDLGGLSGVSNIVNESGLYNVILRSDKPEAKEFKRWVIHEVLPSIRKNGGYLAGQESLSPEQVLANAVLVAHKILADKNREIEEMRPKALFADAVATSKSSILIGELAKLLKQNGVKTGQNRLFQQLRDEGLLIKRRGEDYNMPTQRAMEIGLFEVKERVICMADGSTTVKKTTKVTGRGQQYFINRFLSGSTHSIAQ